MLFFDDDSISRKQPSSIGSLGELVILSALRREMAKGRSLSISILNRQTGVPYGIGARLIDKAKSDDLIQPLHPIDTFRGLIEIGQYVAACEIALSLLEKCQCLTNDPASGHNPESPLPRGHDSE